MCGQVISSSDWEYCAIEREYSPTRVLLRALGRNKLGEFEAGEVEIETSPFPNFVIAETDNAMIAHRELTERLREENWEPCGRGEHWWETEFKRRVQTRPAGEE